MNSFTDETDGLKQMFSSKLSSNGCQMEVALPVCLIRNMNLTAKFMKCKRYQSYEIIYLAYLGLSIKVHPRWRSRKYARDLRNVVNTQVLSRVRL